MASVKRPALKERSQQINSVMKSMHVFANVITVLFIGILLLSGTGIAQVMTRIISGEKGAYVKGDKLIIEVIIEVNPKSCKDGMSMTKVYPSGLEITDRLDWIELKPGVWKTRVNCVIGVCKKGVGMLTIIRRTDKDQLMYQQKFNMQD